MQLWSAIVAFLGILAALVERLRDLRIERGVETRVELEALRRQIEQQEKANEIDRQVADADLAVLRERMRKYQRPD